MDFGPNGPVYQAGNISGNPIAMSAGFAMLSHLKQNPSVFISLDENHLSEEGFEERLKMLNYFSDNQLGSMMFYLQMNQLSILQPKGDNKYFKGIPYDATSLLTAKCI